jgi:hypothetical protein
MVPRRLGCDVDMHGDFNAWISIDRAQRYTVNLIILHSRQSRATAITENQPPIGIYVISLYIRSTGYPRKRTVLNFSIRR